MENITIRDIAEFSGEPLQSFNNQIVRGAAGPEFQNIGRGKARHFGETEAAAIMIMSVAMKHTRSVELSAKYVTGFLEIVRTGKYHGNEPGLDKEWDVVFYFWAGDGGKEENEQFFVPVPKNPTEHMDISPTYTRGNLAGAQYPVSLFIDLVQKMVKKLEEKEKQEAIEATA